MTQETGGQRLCACLMWCSAMRNFITLQKLTYKKNKEKINSEIWEPKRKFSTSWNAITSGSHATWIPKTGVPLGSAVFCCARTMSSCFWPWFRNKRLFVRKTLLEFHRIVRFCERTAFTKKGEDGDVHLLTPLHYLITPLESPQSAEIEKGFWKHFRQSPAVDPGGALGGRPPCPQDFF